MGLVDVCACVNIMHLYTHNQASILNFTCNNLETHCCAPRILTMFNNNDLVFLLVATLGAGGEEAALFSKEVLDMYQR